jgi:hypothetical protein
MLQWTFHPFILQTKRFYTVLIWRRVLAFLCVSVSLLGTLLYVIIWCLLQFVTYTIVSLFLCVFFLQASQFLRIVTFYSTQLPGPNYHCREVRWFIRAIYIYIYAIKMLEKNMFRKADFGWRLLLCAIVHLWVFALIHRVHLLPDYHLLKMQLRCSSLIVRCSFHLFEQTIWPVGCFCRNILH